MNLLRHLPRNSYFQEALSQDDELAEMSLQNSDNDEETASSRIRMADFSPEVEMMMNAIDRLGDVVSGLVGLGGKRPPKITPLRRPETAYERAEKNKDMQRHRRLVAQLVPNG